MRFCVWLLPDAFKFHPACRYPWSILFAIERYLIVFVHVKVFDKTGPVKYIYILFLKLSGLQALPSLQQILSMVSYQERTRIRQQSRFFWVTQLGCLATNRITVCVSWVVNKKVIIFYPQIDRRQCYSK